MTPPSPLSHEAQLIVALDFPAAEPALALARRLSGHVRWLKVGLELYLSAGNSIVRDLRDQGFSVFLDLKLHDIPNTVAGAVRSASTAGASMLTIHALGGPAMMSAAAEAAAAASEPLQLLAVSVLTSMDASQLEAIGISASPASQVQRLARLATASGISGLVASPQEVAQLRHEFPALTLVIPGIRPAGAAVGDQKRIATPAQAARDGANFLVVGRPITQATDPVAATRAIFSELEAIQPA
ncbi:orotidine-5'-phosphate decarboxylase [Silvibacterium dinghuense]|uniref:Orotidine 5'-phosphate decarboxylase n=1 Tax=Silvibacterium dinghuense TaxID=1560006 RepID=A0A4Q1S7V6_9BACT|nr:orotidine-5'-phosphate decarboxylase [Silvibacterium dinghuense]RXS93064.1 orotidine-5'-phosphate decarboxylase [Silvibacterium dinghuense]GGG89700.1 orotidine 5'-phosphate decarboxylase [Silvibacterium dinghuense]